MSLSGLNSHRMTELLIFKEFEMLSVSPRIDCLLKNHLERRALVQESSIGVWLSSLLKLCVWDLKEWS